MFFCIFYNYNFGIPNMEEEKQGVGVGVLLIGQPQGSLSGSRWLVLVVWF